MTRYGVLFVVVLSLLMAIPAQAATFTVSNAAELIAAINTANSNGQADTINLTADIELTAEAFISPLFGNAGLPAITSDIVINGNGFRIFRGVTAPQMRIFVVSVGSNLTLNDIEITSGYALAVGAGVPDGGGNILVLAGTLNIVNSQLGFATSETDGGILFNVSGTVHIENSVITLGTANNSGGGIFNVSGTVNISNSAIESNRAIVSGSGIFNENGTLILNNTAFEANGFVGQNSPGGAIYNANVLTANNVTISGNGLVGGNGGGEFSILVQRPSITLPSRTIPHHSMVVGFITKVR